MPSHHSDQISETYESMDHSVKTLISQWSCSPGQLKSSCTVCARKALFFRCQNITYIGSQNSQMCLSSGQFTIYTRLRYTDIQHLCVLAWSEWLHESAWWADVKYKRPVDKSRGRMRMVEQGEWRGWRDKLLQQEHLKLTEHLIKLGSGRPSAGRA